MKNNVKIKNLISNEERNKVLPNVQALIERIEINQAVLVGKPVIRGTRISVEHIMNMLASGMTQKEVLKEFPHLKKEDILASIFYATELVRDFKAYPRQFIGRVNIV